MKFRSIIGFFFISILGIDECIEQNLYAHNNVTYSQREGNLSPSTWYLWDTSKTIVVDDILSGRYDHIFKSYDVKIPRIGYGEKLIWYKFSLNNDSLNDKDWLLSTDQQGIDSFILYYQDSKGIFQSSIITQMEHYQYKKYRSNTFVFDIPINAPGLNIYYIKAFSKVNPNPIRLYTKENFIQHNLEKNIFQGIFIGFIIMMLLYNLFIFFFEQDKSFLYYVIYVLVNGLMICGYKGYLDYFFQNHQYIDRLYLPGIISLNSLALLLFSRNILELSKNFRLANVVSLLFFIPVLVFSMVFIYNKEAEWHTIVNFLILFSLLVFLSWAAYVVYIRNIRPALFYTIGSLAFLLSLIIYIFTLYGIISINIYTKYVLELGSVAHIMLFSFALGDKIRAYKNLKHQMENDLFNSLKQNEEIILEQNRILEISAAERSKELVEQKEKSDLLLLNILPEDVADELKANGVYEAKLHENVTVLYTDFVNFTKISENLSPRKLVEKLDIHFKAFDEIIERNGLEKIRTIGDAYLAICGLQNESNHAKRAVAAGIQIRDYISLIKKDGELFEIRTGIHSGSVVAGIVGDKKFTYDIWGETVNIASNLEQISLPGKINISGITYNLLEDEFQCIHQGKMVTKINKELDYYFVEYN